MNLCDLTASNISDIVLVFEKKPNQTKKPKLAINAEFEGFLSFSLKLV